MSGGSHENPERDQAIRQRAHEIWEREGRPDARHEEHWRMAEQELAALRAMPTKVKVTKRLPSPLIAIRSLLRKKLMWKAWLSPRGMPWMGRMARSYERPRKKERRVVAGKIRKLARKDRGPEIPDGTGALRCLSAKGAAVLTVRPRKN